MHRVTGPSDRPNRRHFLHRLGSLGLALAGLSVLPGCGFAPPGAPRSGSAKVARLGFLSLSTPDDAAVVRDAFWEGLRELGYVEGQNVTVEYRYAEGREERLPDLAAELVALSPDVIVSVATQANLAAKQATSTIPIVMANSGDPVGTGLVASLARPGGNITGLTALAVGLAAKRLQLLREAVPSVSRVAVLWNAANPSSVRGFAETQDAAQALGVDVQSLEVRGPDDFGDAFASATKGRPDALIAIPTPLINGQRKQIAEFAVTHRLPSMSEQKQHAEVGFLMAYGPNVVDNYRRSATYVDKILKGAKPGDLPIEQPTKFDFVVNLKTAQALGLTIPQPVLIQASEVIQ